MTLNHLPGRLFEQKDRLEEEIGKLEASLRQVQYCSKAFPSLTYDAQKCEQLTFESRPDVDQDLGMVRKMKSILQSTNLIYPKFQFQIVFSP